MKFLPGVHFSPKLGTDDGPSIPWPTAPRRTWPPILEDYYQPGTPVISTVVETHINVKYNVTMKNIRKATKEHQDTLPGEQTCTICHRTGRASSRLATSPGLLRVASITNSCHSWSSKKGQRVGIMMFDFFNEPSDLIDTFLSL
ncbi:hypothetical protein N7532_009984 [Penicillium argentinense]|uniref:Uncharacterized protein n=1 Tax=Penicillium argentinense TaxID=1131581 RepID=A0A9W9JXH7_9EURO|nr:uncharacterized protein N7532_009984 [Penicillium argentinense]KAJ5085213.1 hypothetical protein N7532_009984 [Penicillium argentinense]